MKRKIRLVFVACAALALAACSASGTPGPTINAVDPNFGKLQFAVGTANLYGSASGLNIVSTLRQPNGHSAYGVDAPTITGPFVFNNLPGPANGGLTDPYTTIFPQPPPAPGTMGPSLSEVGASSAQIGSTPETVHPGTPFCDAINAPVNFTSCPAGISPNASTFGQSGGVFAMGLAPYNTVGSTGQSYSYQPYPQPIYEQTTHPQFVAWGGPPAFDPDGDGMGTRDGFVPLGVDSFGFPFFLGVGEGISIFEGVTPSTGSYNMAVVLAILGPNGGVQLITKNAGATMTSTALLPTATTPVVTPDGTGGATFTIAAANFPPGVTEALVQIIDYGPNAGPLHPQGNGGLTAPNCQLDKGTKFAPVYYTFFVTGPGSFTLDAAHGPNINNQGQNLQASPSICTDVQNTAAGFGPAGDNFTVQIIGLDYPGFEAAHSLLSNTVPQAPPLVGANGQADITVSVPQEEDYPGYAPQGLLHVHHHGRSRVQPRVHTAIGRIVGPGM